MSDTNITDDATAPTKRGIAPARAAFLERQRAGTRETIMDGARRLFANTAYMMASMDEILVATGVSRATFYQHFASKLALAEAIYDEIAPAVEVLFLSLATVDPAQADSVLGWLNRYVSLYQEHRYVTPLLAELRVFEPSFNARLDAGTERFIDALSHSGHAVFSVAARGDDDGLVARARARLQFEQLNYACARVALNASISQAEAQAIMRVAAEELARFLSSS